LLTEKKSTSSAIFGGCFFRIKHMPLVRLSALRLAKLNTLYTKEPSDGVVLALRPTPSLSDAQVARLALAAPWNPVMIEADVDFQKWDETDNTFEAEIVTVESAPKVQHGKLKRRVAKQSLIKQYRGYWAHD
jgi:hypothetical protein